MLNAQIETGMNGQLAAELYSSHLYLAMSAYCQSENLSGFAHWLRLQADEERGHGLRLFRQIVDRGGRVRLGPVDAPPADFGSPLGTFEQVLAHEREVTAGIERLYGLSLEQDDYATQVFLQWFVQEQVEEERQAEEILHAIRAVGEDPTSLFLLDRELGARREA